MARLARAAARPVHAYLLVGPRGSGVEEAARCFAASLVASGDDDERAWELVAARRAPRRRRVRPVDDADREGRRRSRSSARCHASPIEGERKVVMLLDADRLNDVAANRLLKTIEEPPRAHISSSWPDDAEALLADDPLALPARRLRVPAPSPTSAKRSAIGSRASAATGATRLAAASPAVASIGPVTSPARSAPCATRSLAAAGVARRHRRGGGPGRRAADRPTRSSASLAGARACARTTDVARSTRSSTARRVSRHASAQARRAPARGAPQARAPAGPHRGAGSRAITAIEALLPRRAGRADAPSAQPRSRRRLPSPRAPRSARSTRAARRERPDRVQPERVAHPRAAAAAPPGRARRSS